ncbi:aminotransferase [Phlebopus sp. FC_14]|nr:aminotransferase [Phlebopus sp. FC_14]
MSLSQLRSTSSRLTRLVCNEARSSCRTPLTFSKRRMSRTVGTDPMTGEAIATSLPDIEPSLLTITRTKSPKQLPPSSKLLFGRTFSDHMLKIPWTEATGWGSPSIEPFSTINLTPSATVLHYAQSLFEGMKAYRHADGTVTMFRPDMNMKRMNISAQRLALPTFNSDALIECLKQLITLERDWIPKEPGHSLYIRPTLIGTNGTLGVQPPNEALLFVICSPAGPYYPQGFKPVPLYGTTDSEYIRAAPGGTGAFKLAANYAPGVIAQKRAAKAGYAQNLWLHGPEHYLTEVGTMNLFVVLKDESGVTELVTPPLDGMILPGVTRDSVLTLAREHASGKKQLAGLPSQLKISERPINMGEIIKASAAGRLVELFGTGTAAVIAPVERIGYLGSDVMLPTGEDGMGPVSRPLWTELVGIQTGAIQSNWNYVVTKGA